jgi:hypothetical protein
MRPQPSAVVRATVADRAYFSAHPAACELVRRPVRGEFSELEPPPGSLVRVCQLGPGLRTRELLLPARRTA